MHCLFVTDLHGSESRYEKLMSAIRERRPEAVFIGGDLLSGGISYQGGGVEFFREYIATLLRDLRDSLAGAFPRIFVIMGNDDPRAYEPDVKAVADEGLWIYLHNASQELDMYRVYGYACVHPTPFLLKDWERYDVSRFVDPGSIPPEQGKWSVQVDLRQIRFRTIAQDLEALTEGADLSNAIFLFHSPPYQTCLDRAALDGQMIDHVPLDVHVGSIAIKRFIEQRQPLVTLHGHIHEAARLTGSWREQIGSTHLLGAAHDGPELALVSFDPANPGEARRELL